MDELRTTRWTFTAWHMPAADRTRLAIEAALGEIAVEGSTLTWQGGPLTTKKFDTLRNLEDPFRKACPLLGEEDDVPWALGGAIYRVIYKELPHIGLLWHPHRDKTRDKRFARDMERAHHSAWTSVPGYRFLERKPGEALVAIGDGQPFWVPSNQLDGPTPDGRTALVRTPSDGTAQSQYMYLFGERGLFAGPHEKIRLYWNVSPQGAVPLAEAATGRLNAWRVPYALKILDKAGSIQADSAVLYFPTTHWGYVIKALPEIYDDVKRFLRHPVPPFLSPLGPGIGLAEDPPFGMSFGQHRSALIAKAIWAGFTAEGRRSVPDADWVLSWLEKEGYPLERFHLNPGTAKDYTVPLEPLRLPTDGKGGA